MDKKLSEPMNHREDVPLGIVLLGCLGLVPVLTLIFLKPNNTTLSDYNTFTISVFVLTIGLWAGLRIHLFDAHHHTFNKNILLAVLLGAILFFVPLFLGSALLFNHFSSTITLEASVDYEMVVFGLIGSSLGELLIIAINKDYQLQKQALEKLALNQEMTIKEVATIANMSEKKVHRALGYQEKVPASVAREWLENVKGIRCPPAVKALA